ncbi:hypothetical protein DFQ28_001233 [Apophysomyces sp. BC1034]|nr:hypothetical protein DFQ28_001233 [Apophysomyces sp. BC1034]
MSHWPSTSKAGENVDLNTISRASESSSSEWPSKTVPSDSQSKKHGSFETGKAASPYSLQNNMAPHLASVSDDGRTIPEDNEEGLLLLSHPSSIRRPPFMPAHSFSSMHSPHVSQFDNESTEMLEHSFGKHHAFDDKDADVYNRRLDPARQSMRRTLLRPKKPSHPWWNLKALWNRRRSPPEGTPRIIYLNNPGLNLQQKFVNNSVSTAKYNVATFLPKFLYDEFSKSANLFFLFISGIQQIPNISPTSRYTTLVPLIIVLLITAVKEIIEDYGVHRSDHELNARKCKIFDGTQFVERRWRDVRVGDICRIESCESFPADLILLSSSEPEGLCYIETSNLDGEVNLKIKQALPETAKFVSPSQLACIEGVIKSEQPNNRLYNYDGTLTMTPDDSVGKPKDYPLDPNKVLLRGAQLRNTAWIYGIAVFTGHESKLMLNSSFIPISLMVTMEIVKFVQSTMIDNDLDIYYEKTDTPAVARSSSLIEELGQVEYIFSDKTGTLTCNEMEFRECSIAGLAYANVADPDRRPQSDNDSAGQYSFQQLDQHLQDSPNAHVIHEFLTSLMTCHTVIPERSEETDEIVYQASSPDEGALVKGASDVFGYKFYARRPHSVNCYCKDVDQEFEILNVCEFNSTRKRMSIVLRAPDGKIKLYCKGADTVILERLTPNNQFTDATLAHLEEFASEGLRTLCYAMREISNEEYARWSQIYDNAATTLVDRADELDKAAEMIEKDMVLLGATAIEDKLQDGVPDTIHTLQEANIKVWVLTGDRQETAINIGYSCKLLTEEMELIICNTEDHDSTVSFLEKALDDVKLHSEPLALIIEGKPLTFALEKDVEKLFYELAIQCKAVICCRVSPLQKALVVKVVKKFSKSILLAVGDGANDVSMIQAAHVGVGISGVEGLQAARSADFSISQFRFLKKLLLVHGSWAYQRLSKMIFYYFYKNVALYLTQFWVLFFIGMVAFTDDAVFGEGWNGGQWWVGTTIFSATLATILWKAALISDIWTKYTWIAIPGSMVIWYIFLPFVAYVGPKTPWGIFLEYEGIIPQLFGNVNYWLFFIMVPLACNLRDYLWKYYKRMYRTRSYHHIQEIQKFNLPDYRPRMDRFRQAVNKVRKIQRLKQTRGFAFSQNDTDQTKLIRLYDTTQQKPTG